ncbi:MAG: hypothetical protein KatS3mg050_1207 [Litorilinea sp.]|nr:MAG: hypothetical protein KatS3mg050_1207 [Litorilinea sp.]
MANARISADGRQSTLPGVIRVLYVGRQNRVVDELAALFARTAEPATEGPDDGEPAGGETPWCLEPIEFTAVTNQKAALHLIRTRPPKVLLVTVDARPNSRGRFCEMVRYRLPTAAIFAVGPARPVGNVHFDGFIQVPLDHAEVLAAIRQIQNQYASHVLEHGPIRLNVATRTVFTPHGQHHMTPKQCALLQFLMLHRNGVVRRQEIMEAIWNTSYMEDTRTLDVHIRWLRECIEPDPSNPIYLKTVRGVGYRLILPALGEASGG